MKPFFISLLLGVPGNGVAYCQWQSQTIKSDADLLKNTTVI